jgi:hypothetical protein
MKEWKKEAASGSLPFAKKYTRRRRETLTPHRKVRISSSASAHQAHFSTFSTHPSNSPSFTRIDTTNREEALRRALKSVSVRKDPHPLFSITYGLF